MRYLSGVRVGRINPKHLQFGLDVEHKRLDLPHFLRHILADSTDLNSELAEIEPPFKRYKATRTALLRYMELAKQDNGERLPPPPGMVFRGAPYDGIARLGRLLRLVGNLPPEAVVPADSKIYDEPLATAVKRFQERHGLRPNGYLTVDTVEQMNVPLSSQVVQIRLTLERYRWLRYTFSQPPMVVNLPEFRLYAFDRDGRVGLTMKVNVVDAYDFQTPVFENSIRYLVFRPYWNDPPKILRNGLFLILLTIAAMLKDNHMEVTTPGDQVVASGVISDSVLQQLRTGKRTVRQKPGPDNALGLLKIIFPNEHHVYLQTRRRVATRSLTSSGPSATAVSHLEHPAELAAWLLRDKPDWSLQRLQHAMHEGKDNFTVPLPRPVPILIVYGTVVAEPNGEIHFYRDIYGHDPALEKALAKGYPYPK